jgi:hypothetical protein
MVPELAKTRQSQGFSRPGDAPGRYDLNLWIGDPFDGATYLPR